MRGRHSRCPARLLLAVALAVLLALWSSACTDSRADSDKELMVFAAASLRDALLELVGPFKAATGVGIVLNLAGSNVLASQIRSADVADVFLSADLAWLVDLEERGRLVPGTRRALLSNALVVIAHPRGPSAIESLAALTTVDFEHLVLGDPKGVPAGRYARAYLSRVEVDGTLLWDLVAARVVPCADVRAALALVAAEPEAIGIVYRTDVEASSGVEIIFEIAPDPDLPIVYGGAGVVNGPAGSEAAAELLDFLESATARDAFERHGFAPPP